MEIRNRDDAEFILKHRVAKELGRQWKKKGRMLYMCVLPAVVYTFCIIGLYPNAGEPGGGHIPDGVSWGFLVLLFWLFIPALVGLICYEKDKELLLKKYMDEATRDGKIDSE